jgi:LRRFIP family
VGRDTRSFNSRRSSTDSSEDGGGGLGGGVRELRQEMRDLEDKFKKAMVANASLDNEKCQLIFQVDLNHSVPVLRTCTQCCGAGPFLSGSSLSKIPAPAPAQTMFPIKLGKIQRFSWFQKNFMFLKYINDH